MGCTAGVQRDYTLAAVQARADRVCKTAVRLLSMETERAQDSMVEAVLAGLLEAEVRAEDEVEEVGREAICLAMQRRLCRRRK